MKKKIRKILIGIGAAIILLVFFAGYKIASLYIIKQEIMGDGRYDIRIRCNVSDGIIHEYIPMLEIVGIDVDEIILLAQKDASEYKGELYVNGYDEPVVEFYESGEKVYINISSIVRFVSKQGENILPDKIVEILDFEKDYYITNDAVEELVGKRDRTLEESIGKMIDIKFRYSLGILNADKRNVKGTLETDKGKIKFNISYKENNKICLDKPNFAISKFDVIVARKVSEYIVELYREHRKNE